MSKFKDKFLKIVSSNDNDDDDALETSEEKNRRWNSIYIVQFTMFMSSLSFSIILTAIWPFLDKLDPTAGKEFMGYVVAANPLGQMIFSPLIGHWANKRGSVRIPVMFTLVIFIFSNGLYAFLELFTSNQKYWLLISRFLVGVSAANTAVTRSYISAATRFKERTWAISIISLMQVLGFVIGPSIQSVVSFIGEEGYQISGDLRLNMFTTTGWLNAVAGVVNLVLFFPYFFQDYNIAAKEAMVCQGKTNEEDTWKLVKPDYLACWTMIFSFFIISFSFVLPETLATSLTMDQFAWTKTESIRYVGILLGAGSLVAIVVFLFTKQLTRIFLERKLLLWGGFTITTLAVMMLLPWDTKPPKLALPGNYSMTDLNTMLEHPDYSNLTLAQLVDELNTDKEELLGCPVIQQSWCEHTRSLVVPQFYFAYILASVGYPLSITLIQTIFSKMLGPRPQGVWMGLLTGGGCLSRVMGPVFVGVIYSRYGTIVTFSITTLLLLGCMLWIFIINKRLTPADLSIQTKNVEMKEFISKSENGGALQAV